MPVMPVKLAGWRIEPAGIGAGRGRQQPRGTAAAEPPDEPPGTRLVSHGLRTTPNAEFSLPEPIANSSQLSLPRVTAPASPSRSSTAASNGLRYPSSIREPAVLGRSARDEDVLVRNRHAEQRAVLAARPARIGGFGLMSVSDSSLHNSVPRS
jgi:hypothetical protein